MMSLALVSSATLAMAVANAWLSVTVFVSAVDVVPEMSESWTAGLKKVACTRTQCQAWQAENRA